MELPNIPLFKEQSELASLPQIALSTLMKKYDGETSEEIIKDEATGTEKVVKKIYKITRLPKYLFIHMKRFSKNTFFKEKN
jgi:U4/U6.U5 tri-snRNP-associated protein 2